MLRIFMDESGTHDRSPAIAVGSYFAKPKVWKEFTKAWNAAKKSGARPIEVFHSTDCEALREEFEGWTEKERNELVAQLTGILANHHLAGYGIGINMRAFAPEFDKRPHLREIFGTPYVACFQWAVERILEAAESNQALAFIHEENDYQRDAGAAFAAVKARRRKHRGPMSITFGSKADYVPLQAADVLAFETNKRMRDLTRPARRSIAAMDPTSERLIIEGFGPDNVPDLISRLEIMAEEISLFGKAVDFVKIGRKPTLF